MDRKSATYQKTDEKCGEIVTKLIPHLAMNQLLQVEYKNQGTWKRLFEPVYVGRDIMHVNCALCSIDVPWSIFKNHIKEKSHLDALNEVETFFQPLDSTNRHMMSIHELLDIEFQHEKDGKWQKILSPIGPVREKSKYTCNICNRTCMGSIPLNAHLRGNAHRLAQNNTFAMRSSQSTGIDKRSVLSFTFEGEALTRRENLLDDLPKKFPPKAQIPFQEGLVGIEYVVRIQKAKGEFAYACCLCNCNQIFETEELMEDHLIGFFHRRAYFEKHYPDTMKHFEGMVKSSGLPNRTGMTFVFSKIAHCLEKYHHYGKPHRTTYDCFMSDKKKISDLVEGLPHACQGFGPSFSNVVTIDKLIALKNNIGGHISSPGTTTKARFAKNPSGKFYLNMKRHLSRTVEANRESYVSAFSTSSGMRFAQHSHEKRGYSKSSGTRSRSISPHSHHSRKRRLSPLNIGEDTGVWSTFRRRISEAASDLEQTHNNYRQHPEKHPNYDKEWSMFWKHRKNELRLDGIDYRSYDFQPEWTAHFRQRLEQIFAEKLQNLKIEVRRQLNIPLNAEEDTPFFHTERSHEPSPLKRQMSQNRSFDDVESISRRAQPQEKAPIWNPPASIEHERPNIIGLLRLMTALDDHLGSTGDKILDLLTKALSLEKVYGADSTQLEQKILNANNCRLLKLAQEKLKSQLYANLVENKKINSFNRVIECAEILLNRADSMGWSNAEEPSSAPPSSIEIVKLIEALQEKTKEDFPVAKKKSLTDTLMELMTPKNDTSHSTNHLNSPNQMGQRNYGFHSNSLALSQFTGSQKTSYLADTFRSHSGADSRLSFQTHDNNLGVWNRLGSHTNYAHRNPQSFVNNFTNDNDSNNIRGGHNVIGGNNAYGSLNPNGVGNYKTFDY